MDLFKKQRLQDGYQGAFFFPVTIYSVYRNARFLNTGYKKARLLEKYESNTPLRKWEAIKRMSIKKKSICRV